MLTVAEASRPRMTGLKRHSRHLLWSCAALAALLVLAYAYFGSPRLASGLRYQVFAEGLQDVSALALDPNGDLYATLERHHGQGQLVHIRKGLVSVILQGLDKPDGILQLGDSLYITSEEGPHGLSAYTSGRRRELNGALGAEGIADAGAGKILVIEDRKQGGHLLRINPETQKTEVLLDGLVQAEGVCQTPKGDIYFVEKNSDRLARYVDGHNVTAATGLTKPAFLNCLADGSILITEDRTNAGRLLRYRDGAIKVLARYLGAPQSVVVGRDGAYYLAEQRKNRILRIYAY